MVSPRCGTLPTGHLVQDHAERVDVDAPVGVAAAGGLLGRHVLGRAEHGARAGQARLGGAPPSAGGDLRDAEVDDLDEVGAAVAIGQEHVLGLEIAVDDALVVRGAERARDLRGDPDRAQRRERCGGA